MSYDLFFYKHKNSALTQETIRNYLTENLATPNEQNNQWWFENEDTGTYFSFETTDENDFENYTELYNSFIDFDDVHLLFNLNFIRPNFFGLEAFSFVQKFISDLDLYLLNPQLSDNDMPYKPRENELYEDWVLTNEWAAKENFNDESCYYPSDKTNEIWNHNFNRLALQAQYNEVYYVPRIYLMEQYKTKSILTQTSWVKHYPYIIPKADYILIVRDKKGLFKSEETEQGFISYQTLVETFGEYFEDIDLPGYKLISPAKAETVSSLFSNLKFEKKVDKLGLRIPWEKVFNSKPN